MIRAFVSSISVGLEDTRRQIIADLRTAGFDVDAMEQFGAQPQPPIDVCLREVRKADVVILLIGPRYGSLIPQGISYTQAEFREAQGAGTPVLAFRIANAPDLTTEDRERLDSFATEVGNTAVYRALSPSESLERLSAMVLAALSGARDRGELGHRFSIFQRYERFFVVQLGSTPALLNHGGPFIGRDAQLEGLMDFINSSEPLLLLKAPGGAGKSRLLLEAAKRAQQHPESPRILFVDSAAGWSAEDIGNLPVGPVVLIFDDAHRRPDLDRLIAACQQRNEGIRCIVSCRPSAVGIVRPLVAQLVSSTEPPEMELPRLTKSDAEALARESLGLPLHHLAERLVAIADRNPLVIRIGARCIADKLVVPEVLERTPEIFRRLVLDRLLDDHALTAVDSVARRQILEVIAAIGPVVTENDELLTELAKIVNLAVHEIRRLVAALERTQFLMRRGRLVRVSPDVLADHLLYRAAVDENGNPTGFVDAMVASFRPSLENILANGAELDWRASATAHHESVLEAVWRDLLQLLPTFSNRQRAELVGQLKRAAIFAPADVLAMCEWLIGHPEAPTDELLTRWGLKDTSDKLNRALTDVVALIATHPDFTRRCATQLWKLAAQDDRPQNPHPDHPRRRLEDLVKYERSPGRDAGDVVQVQAIDFLISRLLDASRDKSAVWAVSALANALNRTGEANEWNRRTLTLGEFSLSSFLDQLADRRRAVVRCLKHLALEKKLDEAAAAIAELGALLRAPRGPFGRGLESSEIAVWQPEAEEGIATLQAIAQSAHSEVVRYLARRELRSAPQDHWPQIAPSLEHALEEIEPVLGERLYDLLLGVPWEEQLKDWPSEEARVGDISEAVAVAFWKQHQTPQAVVDVLLAALSAIQGTDRRGGNSQVGRLVYALVRTSPHGPRELIERLAAHEGGWHLLRPALIATHEKEPALAEALSSELSASEHEAVRANALDSVQWMLERAADLKALVALTKKLSQDASPDVRGAASRVLRRLAKHAPADAVDILASIDWSSELWLADAALGVLDARYGIDPTLLSDGHVDSLLTRIEQLHSLEGRNYEVLQFIAFASERRPRQTVEMLIRRIRAVDEHREDERNSDQWIPIPYNGHGLSLPGIRLASNQQELVGLIRDASLHAAGMVHFWLPVLFHAADPGLEAGRIILRDWITSGESEKIVGAASLLRGFDHSIVFVEHELISELIEAASRCGAECLRDASGELYAIAGSGVYTGAPGEPAPRHLHDKSESERLAQVYADREPVRGFYQSLVASAESNIRFDVALGGEEDE